MCCPCTNGKHISDELRFRTLYFLRTQCEFDAKGCDLLPRDDREKMFVRSGIRTHAHRSGLRPERSALDRSAILTA